MHNSKTLIPISFELPPPLLSLSLSQLNILPIFQWTDHQGGGALLGFDCG